MIWYAGWIRTDLLPGNQLVIIVCYFFVQVCQLFLNILVNYIIQVT